MASGQSNYGQMKNEHNMSEKIVNQDEAVTPTTEIAEPVYPGPLKLTLIMLALCLAVFLVALDQTILGVVGYDNIPIIYLRG